MIFQDVINIQWSLTESDQTTLLDQKYKEKADRKTHDPPTDPAEWSTITELCRTSKLYETLLLVRVRS